jgi:hypothetical protein
VHLSIHIDLDDVSGDAGEQVRAVLAQLAERPDLLRQDLSGVPVSEGTVAGWARILGRGAADAKPAWKFAPFVGVGPLRFGMTHDEAVAALGGENLSVDGLLPHDAPHWTHDAMRLESAESQSGVALYYDADTSQLHGIAVGLQDSRRPQGWQPVEFNGLQLVGRPRELVENQLADRYSVSHEMYYGPAGDFGFGRLGLGIRTVRAWPTGLVTRALFVSKQITESCWDDYNGYLRRDWDKHR